MPIDEEEPPYDAFVDPVRALDTAADLDAPASQLLFQRGAGPRLVALLVVRADEQPAAQRDEVREQVVDQRTPLGARHVFEPRSHEIEAEGRTPRGDVPLEQTVRPPGQSRPSQRYELWGDVQAIRLHDQTSFGAPRVHALHQE